MNNAIEQLWIDYHARLHSFVQSRVGDPSLADDILQDVFIKIHKRIDTLKDTNKIQSWMYQITRNTIIDQYRSQKPMVELPTALAADEEEPDKGARQEMASCLVPMIRSLPAHYSEALMLSEVEGLTQKEVAAMQGVSLPAAKARVQRGRAMMKDKLLDCCRFEFDHQGKVVDYEGKGEACGDGTCDRCE